jgi:hypothetical protein
MAWDLPVSYGLPAIYDAVEFEKQAEAKLGEVMSAEVGDSIPLIRSSRDQLPNHRCRRVEANSSFSAARSAEGPRNGAVGAGPDKKSASTLPTKPPPNSM